MSCPITMSCHVLLSARHRWTCYTRSGSSQSAAMLCSAARSAVLGGGHIVLLEQLKHVLQLHLKDIVTALCLLRCADVLLATACRALAATSSQLVPCCLHCPRRASCHARQQHHINSSTASPLFARRQGRAGHPDTPPPLITVPAVYGKQH